MIARMVKNIANSLADQKLTNQISDICNSALKISTLTRQSWRFSVERDCNDVTSFDS